MAGVCNHGEPHVGLTRREYPLTEREKWVERAIINTESMAFYWLSPWQERRGIFSLPPGLCHRHGEWMPPLWSLDSEVSVY